MHHRIANSNDRILALHEGHVHFRWRDYADGNRSKVMFLPAEEFLRRFLLHVLPTGFQRIHHFGLLANRRRALALARYREPVHTPAPPSAPPRETTAETIRRLTSSSALSAGKAPYACWVPSLPGRSPPAAPARPTPGAPSALPGPFRPTLTRDRIPKTRAAQPAAQFNRLYPECSALRIQPSSLVSTGRDTTFAEYSSAMSELIRHTLGVYFDLAFLQKKGTEFEDFFADIMELRHPADFSRVRPWGRKGDEKCDGYLASLRQLFAVYAPESFTESKLVNKIDSDFGGVAAKWKPYVDTWTFVHNDPDGMAPAIVKKITDLKSAHADLEVSHWGKSELKTEAMILSTDDLEKILGPVPKPEQLANLAFEELRLVVESIERSAPKANEDISSVPPGKLDANALSEDIRGYLQLGMARSNRVGEFFRRYHDPELGDAVAEQFKQKYAALKMEGLHPDEIFQRLFIFAAGPERLPLPREAAVMAVLAYLFESCDIFESPVTKQ